MSQLKSTLAAAMLMLLAVPQVHATATAEEAAQLGKELTPMGSVRAGNADGSVPAYTGESNFEVPLSIEYKGKPVTAKTINRQLLVDLWIHFEDFRANGPAALRKKVEEIIAGEPKDMRTRLEALQLDVQQNWSTYYKELKPDYKARLVEAGKLFVIAGKPVDGSSEAALRGQIEGLISVFNDQIAQLQGKIGNADKPLYTITPANMAQHADKLTEGHKALFKAYPTYKMHVYPTVRTAFFPKEVDAATIKNATAAKLEGTESVIGAELGFPFPIPKSGAEVLWNHKLKFRGSAVKRFNDQAIVRPDGKYKITKLVEDVKFKYANLAQRPAAGNKIFAFYLAKILSPPRVAGQIYLVHEPFVGLRTAWIYNPGLGRINRAPDVGYDNPSVGSDGEQFNDQVDIFNGALDRYDWKLVGRRDILIPYNSFLINGPAFKYTQLLTPLHINQKNSRYELHRVWVVDATLKQGLRHAFKRRTFYLDEDSWAIAVVDCYDNRDQMWKVQEGHLFTAPFIPTVSAIPELIYDLQSRRYFATTLTNEAEIIDFNISFDDSHFDPANLKRIVRAQ